MNIIIEDVNVQCGLASLSSYKAHVKNRERRRKLEEAEGIMNVMCDDGVFAQKGSTMKGAGNKGSNDAGGEVEEEEGKKGEKR